MAFDISLRDPLTTFSMLFGILEFNIVMSDPAPPSTTIEAWGSVLI